MSLYKKQMDVIETINSAERFPNESPKEKLGDKIDRRENHTGRNEGCGNHTGFEIRLKSKQLTRTINRSIDLQLEFKSPNTKIIADKTKHVEQKNKRTSHGEKNDAITAEHKRPFMSKMKKFHTPLIIAAKQGTGRRHPSLNTLQDIPKDKPGLTAEGNFVHLSRSNAKKQVKHQEVTYSSNGLDKNVTKDGNSHNLVRVIRLPHHSRTSHSIRRSRSLTGEDDDIGLASATKTLAINAYKWTDIFKKPPNKIKKYI